LDGYKENNACDFAIKESSLKSFFTPASPVLLLLCENQRLSTLPPLKFPAQHHSGPYG